MRMANKKSIMLNENVDDFFLHGCGRCNLVGTPNCKAIVWNNELTLLRKILLSTGLKEERKWGVACYTVNGSNVILISALKSGAIISFLKGALLNDPANILEKPGPNSQHGRLIRFNHSDQIIAQEFVLREYIEEAKQIELSGKKIEKDHSIASPKVEELNIVFEENPKFKSAFLALTPGKQRGYLIYFAQAKQSETRLKRINKHIPGILQGKGFHDK